MCPLPQAFLGADRSGWSARLPNSRLGDDGDGIAVGRTALSMSAPVIVTELRHSLRFRLSHGWPRRFPNKALDTADNLKSGDGEARRSPGFSISGGEWHETCAGSPDL